MKNKLLFGSKAVFDIVLFLLVASVVFVIAYFFNAGYLGSGISGNDTANYLTFTKWFSVYFPHIPFWFPLQGGGVSIRAGYPIFAALLVNVIDRLTPLDLIQSFRLLGFVSVPLTAFGIYILVFSRFKTHAMGLLAALLYLISPIAYVWIDQWGFYSEAISYIFVPWTILFYLVFWDIVKEGKRSFPARGSFVLACFFFVLSFLAHPSALGVIMFLIFYTFFEAVVRKKQRLTYLKRALFASIAFVGTSFLLSAFSWVQLFNYTRVANRDGLTNVVDPKLIGQGIPNLLVVLSLKIFDPMNVNFAYQNISFPVVVWILVIAGTIISVFISRKIFVMALFTAYTLIFGMSADISAFLSKYLPVIGGSPVSWRSLFVPLRVVVPIVGAYGVYGFIYFIFSHKILKKWLLLNILRSVFVGVFTIIVGLFILIQLRSLPNSPQYMANYGVHSVNLQDIWRVRANDACTPGAITIMPMACSFPVLRDNFNIQELYTVCSKVPIKDVVGVNSADICGILTKSPQAVSSSEIQTIADIISQCHAGNRSPICSAMVKPLSQQLALENWPKLRISSDLTKPLPVGLLSFLDKLKPETRVDMSPYLPSLIMLMSYYTNIPQMQVYTTQLSLTHLLWGIQSNAFYLKDITYNVPKQLNEMAEWFGIGYTVLPAPESPFDKYIAAGWKEVYKDDSKNTVWKSNGETSLAEVSNKPAVLVLGNRAKQTYPRLFVLATDGLLDYNSAMMFEGEKNIDGYSLNELKQFKVVILHGYTYSNRDKAWSLLDSYVKQGGSLYIDTGWQYTVPDWKLDTTPEFLPLTSLSWNDLGQTNAYQLKDTTLSNISVAEFSPLVYGDSSWFVSSSQGNLRDNSQVVLSAAGFPLIVKRQYGAGKVVWSGMNLLEHIQAFKNNPSELQLANALFLWLLDTSNSAQAHAVPFTRENPDKVVFNLGGVPNNAIFYWKEASYPGWNANIEDSNSTQPLSLYRAGPGFTAAFLPNVASQARIVLEYRSPFSEIFPVIISGCTVLILLLYLFYPKLFRISLPRIKIPGRKKIKMFDMQREEEDY